jgi:hypothetical protein
MNYYIPKAASRGLTNGDLIRLIGSLSRAGRTLGTVTVLLERRPERLKISEAAA